MLRDVFDLPSGMFLGRILSANVVICVVPLLIHNDKIIRKYSEKGKEKVLDIQTIEVTRLCFSPWLETEVSRFCDVLM